MKNFNEGIIIQFLIRPQIKFIKESLKGFAFNYIDVALVKNFSKVEPR